MKKDLRDYLSKLNSDNIEIYVESLLSSIKNNYVDNNQCTIMFYLYNWIYPTQKETTMICTKCRARVYKRLQEWQDSRK